MGCLTLLLSFTLIQTTSAELKVQLFAGTAFEPIEEIFPYTSSTTLIYKLNFTTNFKIPSINNTALECKAKTSLSDPQSTSRLTPHQRVMQRAASKTAMSHQK